MRFDKAIHNLTIGRFGPNDPQFGATFEGWEGLSEEDLLSIFQYSIIQSSPPMYSSNFKNNSKLMTLESISSTMTETDDGVFINAARITTRDYLTSNGVLQVINR